MAEEQQAERDEPATPRRREKFREKGQVAKSKEVSGVMIFFGVLLYFYYYGQEIFLGVSEFFIQNFDLAYQGDLDLDKMVIVMHVNVGIYFALLTPFFILVFILSYFGNFIQVGWLVTTKPLMPDLKRVDPISKFKEMFLSPKIFTETGINVLKVSVLVAVVYNFVVAKIQILPGLIAMTPYHAAATILSNILQLMTICTIFFIAVALVDYLYQWQMLEKKMRMTKQEVKDETKDSEGDPHVKGQIRSRMREISMNKIIDTVPGADVVVTNPTHIAVALSYEQGVDKAPKVLAKGKGFWAERIKIIAKENGVEIVEDKLLARAIHKSAIVGREIPTNLFKAVAELLAYVYGLKQQGYTRTTKPYVRKTVVKG